MQRKRILWPITAFLVGSGLMTGIYFGIVSLAEGFEHAVDFFIEDRWLISPLILGFGIQSSLFIILKKQLFIPISNMGASGTMTGAGGTTSTLGMVACCAHHVTDVLPILGLSAAATFLAEYQTVFMFIGLGTTLIGILVMVRILIRERKKALGIAEVSKPSFGKFNKTSYVVLASILGIVGLGFGLTNLNSPKTVEQILLEDNTAQDTDVEQSIDSFSQQEIAPASENGVTQTENTSDTPENVQSAMPLWFLGGAKLDEQGAVAVQVTPIQLDPETNTLHFDVSMNTHSVDLSMDLAKLATLSINLGEGIEGDFWDGPAGGHHVSGKLSFTLTDDEITMLQESTEIQLSIVEVDAAERLFTWTKDG